MTVEPDNAALEVRAALIRKSLADATLRGAIARLLGVTETEILAILHLARSGEFDPEPARIAAAVVFRRDHRADQPLGARRPRDSARGSR